MVYNGILIKTIGLSVMVSIGRLYIYINYNHSVLFLFYYIFWERGFLYVTVLKGVLWFTFNVTA